MMSHAGQPKLAMHCQSLLFRPVIATPQWLRGRTQCLKGPGYRSTSFSGRTGLGLAVTVTHFIAHFFPIFLNFQRSKDDEKQNEEEEESKRPEQRVEWR